MDLGIYVNNDRMRSKIDNTLMNKAAPGAELIQWAYDHLVGDYGLESEASIAWAGIFLTIPLLISTGATTRPSVLAFVRLAVRGILVQNFDGIITEARAKSTIQEGTLSQLDLLINELLENYFRLIITCILELHELLPQSSPSNQQPPPMDWEGALLEMKRLENGIFSLLSEALSQYRLAVEDWTGALNMRTSRTNLFLARAREIYEDAKREIPSTPSPIAIASHSGKNFQNPSIVLSNDRDAKYDNFFSPENDHFYSTVDYSTLDPERREIRLVRVDFGNEGGQWTCKLIENVSLVSLDLKFAAVSYCAGSARNTRPVLVNGIVFNIFANLGHALDRIISYWQKNCQGRECLLWIDQICINQSNRRERERQVTMMRDIYQNAADTLICLSTEKSPPQTDAFKWMRNVEQPSVPDGSESERFYKRQFYFRLQDESFVAGWRSMYDVLVCPWWSRAWVAQELVCSSRPLFLFGSETISWSEMGSCLVWFLKGHDIHPQLFNESERNQGLSDEIIRYSQDQIRGARESILGATWLVKLKYNWSGPGELVDMLRHGRHRLATDPRDNVYGVLGLASSAVSVVPNYAISPVDLFIDIAKKIALHTRSLDVLFYYASAADRGPLTDELPSWVPDWTQPEITAKERFLGKFTEYWGGVIPRQFEDVAFEPHEGSPDRVLVASGTRVAILETERSTDVQGGSAHQHLICIWDCIGGVYTNEFAKAGDILWFFVGCRIPYVARSYQDGWWIISPVFLVSRHHNQPPADIRLTETVRIY